VPNNALPTGAVWANPGGVRPPPNFYATQFTNPVPLLPTLIGATGGILPHNNLMPYLVVNFCIATQGDPPAKE
jgi:microcystin-dependent protein